MDALANPENINRIIIVWLDEYSVLLGSQTDESNSDPGVQILNNFTNYCQPIPKDLTVWHFYSNYFVLFLFFIIF